MVMKIQIAVFWVVVPGSNVKAVWSSKTLVSYNTTLWHHNPEDHDFVYLITCIDTTETW